MKGQKLKIRRCGATYKLIGKRWSCGGLVAGGSMFCAACAEARKLARLEVEP